jgi:hypothetical protein
MKNRKDQISPVKIVDDFLDYFAAYKRNTHVSHLNFAIESNRVTLVRRDEPLPLGVCAELPQGCKMGHLLTAVGNGKSDAVAAVKAVQKMQAARRSLQAKLKIEAMDHLANITENLLSTSAPERQWSLPETKEVDFGHWKSLDPVKEMCGRLGLDLNGCQTWSGFTEYVVETNRASGRTWVGKVREEEGSMSLGERPVLWAMLHAADFSWLADELSDGRFLRKVEDTHGDHRRAVALALLRED